VGYAKNDANNEEIDGANDDTNNSSKISFNATHKIEIEVENYGTIYVDLDEIVLQLQV